VGRLPRVHKKRATLTDVARRAGVSVTTASYILNGRTEQMRISGDTERKVRAAMRELDYRPNWNARTLRASKTHTIGVISDFLAGGAYAGELVLGANSAARDSDHLVVIGETLGDRETERLMVEALLARQVDGVIYATLTASEVRVPEALREGPTVLLNCIASGLDLPAVMPDDEQGGRLAGLTLLQRGLDGPVYVVGEDPTPGATAGAARVSGVRAALAEAGHELAGVLPYPWDVVPVRESLGAWLSDRRNPVPAALVCLNDRVALGAYQALAAHGLSVPGDVAVISFDGSHTAGWMQPRLTSLRLPLAEMGALAVATLLDPQWRSAGVVRLPLVLEPGDSLG
jgi:LacI family transcriptional regulator